MLADTLLAEVRARFAHVESCPFEGPRIFFENAGGALTLNSVVETSARFAAIPDNQGRANPASAALVEIIARGKADAMDFFGARNGQVFVGESGTELLFRVIRAACLAHRGSDGAVIGSTIEHPASRSAAMRWAEIAGLDHVSVPHDDARGCVTPEHYAAHMREDVKVATILHTSPVTGIGMDLAGIVATIRSVAPECFIVVDGIQHAAHGAPGIGDVEIDAYVVSPYKMFSRHGYGLTWISERLAAVEHDRLLEGPEGNWELGTRDTGAYATFSDVVAYLDWLGSEAGGGANRRERLDSAARAIAAQEHALCQQMLHGAGNLRGLADMPGVMVLGGMDNPHREGLVSFTLEGREAAEIVEALRQRGIRTHTRKADHYSGSVLRPLGLESCVRVSLCHYNSPEEVARFLAAMEEIISA